MTDTITQYCPWIVINVGSDGRVTISNGAGSVTIMKTESVTVNLPAGTFNISNMAEPEYDLRDEKHQ